MVFSTPVGTDLSLVSIPGVGLTPSQSQSSLQVTGQMLELTVESASGQEQPDSEFGCSKDHDFEFESGKHDVALFLEESVLHEEEEDSR